MSLLSRVGKGSSIYTITAFLQRGIGFLLLPLYTRYLTPDDYGILAVVSAVSTFLSILCMLSLNGSMTRYYFEYRDKPSLLKEFWGTVLTFILMISTSFGILLLVLGEYILKPVIGDIPYWPFMALGVSAVIFQPFFSIYLSLLQTTEQSFAYGVYSIAQFLISVLLIISLVVFAGWRAEGPLAGSLIVAILFFFVSFWGMRNQIKFGIKWKYLKEALRYSLPLVPHDLSAQVSSVVNRMFLNSFINTASAGLYNIGFTFGSIMSFVTMSVNRAYVPVFMDVMAKKNMSEMENLRNIGLFLVVIYCLIGTAISFFSREVLVLFTTRAFHESYVIIPYITFTFVLNGIYFIYVNILFFVKKATKFVAIGTFSGAIVNVLMGWWIIPKLGITGAAVTALFAQLVVLVIIFMIGRMYDEIRWHHLKFGIIFLISFLPSVIVNKINGLNCLLFVGIKIILMIILLAILSFIAWGSGTYLIQKGYHITRGLFQRL